MSNAKYTPAPWAIRKHLDNDDNWTIIAPGVYYICELGGNWQGNAPLIAAAPDLLESLELLVSALEADGVFKRPMNEISHTVHALQFARMDIAKAKGGV